MGTTEWIVVILVVGARLLLPLLIPYFPVPALLACLILDSVDQSIFQQFPAIPLDGYQSYDKALDVYYLSIAYISTLRNWTNQGAFRMAQLPLLLPDVGVVAFEMTQVAAILFIFPNTFEYFFDFRRGRAARLGHEAHGQVDGDPLRGGLIWIFIKLPQEWWIHIAQLDMTDFIKETLFGVDPTPAGARRSPTGRRCWCRDHRRGRHRRHRLLDHHEEGAASSTTGRSLKADPLPPTAARRGAYRKVRRRDQHLRLGAAREGRADRPSSA